MRHVTIAAVLIAVTAVGVAFHRPTSGQAEAARPEEVDVASAALAKADALAKSDPKRAAAFYRACIALEAAGGDLSTVREARSRLAALEPKPAPAVMTVVAPKPLPRKGTVATLAEKYEATPEVTPVKVEAPRARAVSVGPDGTVYDAGP